MEDGYKTIFVMLNGLGIGPMPDTTNRDDKISNTLRCVSENTNKLRIPNLIQLGLSNLTYIKGWQRKSETMGYYGKIRKKFPGNEKPIGCWEMLGFQQYLTPLVYEGKIPEEMLSVFEKSTGVKFIGNIQCSHNTALERFGAEHTKSKNPIIYLMPDSSINIAANTSVYSIEQLYAFCQRMMHVLQDNNMLKLFARPFEEKDQKYTFLGKDKFFLIQGKNETILETMLSNNIEVYSVGQFSQIFNGRGFTDTLPVSSSWDVFEKIIGLLQIDQSKESRGSLIFADFDHSFYDEDHSLEEPKQIKDYGSYLEKIDSFLPYLFKAMTTEDILFIFSSYSANPTVSDEHYTDEYLPILAYSKLFNPYDMGNLGIRYSLRDITKTILEIYSIEIPFYQGESFWNKICFQI